MGALRGFFVVVISVLLFISFFAVILTGVLSLSLTYDNVQKESSGVVKNLLQDYNVTSGIQKNLNLIQSYCMINSNQNYIFSSMSYTFDIPCNIVSQGSDAIVNEGIKQLVRQVYYAEYNCNFLDCAKSNQIPLFLISQKAYNFWTNNFYILILVSLILMTSLFLLTEKKSNMFIISGILLSVASVPFIKLDILLNGFSNKIISQFLGIFFSQTFFISLRTLILGIVLIIIGVVLKIFDVGFWISNLIEKMKRKNEPQKRIIKKQSKK